MEIQQLICAMADKVLESIIVEARKASILVDETPDLSRQEQLTFILRYVDSHCAVCERFVGVLQIARTDAESSLH